MGSFQAVKPLVGEEGVGPALMAEPPASFDPLFEGRQHPLRPDRRFDPSPAGQGASGACSPCGHGLQSVSLRVGHRVSTFLHPFAPPELPGFLATMGALTPGRPALRILIRDIEGRLVRRPGLPVSCHRTFRSFRLQTPTVVPAPFWVLYAGLTGPPRGGRPVEGRASLGLRHSLAGSPQRSAESSSLALRTNRSPPSCFQPWPQATQLPSVTGCQNSPARTFTLRVRCTCRRTGAGSCRRSFTSIPQLER